MSARATKVFGLLAVVCGALVAAAAPARAQTATGPSFDCAAPGVARDILPQIICMDPNLAKADLAFSQAYQALRQQVGEAGLRDLRREAVEFTNGTMEACGLAKGMAATPELLAQSRSCLATQYGRQRLAWIERLSPDARQEAERPLDTHLRLQGVLQSRGYLPEEAVIDGVYGPATRIAISLWQQDAGRQPTGLLSAADAMALATTKFSMDPNRRPPAPIAPAAASAAPAAARTPVRATGQDITLVGIESARLMRGLDGSFTTPPGNVSREVKICTAGFGDAGPPNDTLQIMGRTLSRERQLRAIANTWYYIGQNSPRAQGCDVVAFPTAARPGEADYARLPVILSISAATVTAELNRMQAARAEAERVRLAEVAARTALEADIRAGRGNGLAFLRSGTGNNVCTLEGRAALLPEMRKRSFDRLSDVVSLTPVTMPTLNAVFLALKASQCGTYFGPPEDIRQIAASLTRDGISSTVIGPFIPMADAVGMLAEAEEARLRAERANAEQERLAAEARRREAERAAEAQRLAREEIARCEASPACRAEKAAKEAAKEAERVAQEAAREREREARIAAREAESRRERQQLEQSIVARITCQSNGYPFNIAACFSGNGGGSLRIRTGNVTKSYDNMEIMQMQTGNGIIEMPLTNPFEIFAQAPSSDYYKLRVQIMNGLGQTLHDEEAMNYRVIRVRN